MTKKPIILLNIDSLMANPLEVAIQTGRAPALEFLMEKGTYYPKVVSSFPTMSVTIDSSILTGTYADQHKIPGLNWFDIKKNEIINYGTGFLETYRSGMKKTIHQMLYQLNNEHLSQEVSTIFEELAKRGIPSASINSFVYRGNTPTSLSVPKLLKTLTPFKDGTWETNAPPILSLGALSKMDRQNRTFQIAAGNFRFVRRELIELIRHSLPLFTFCVFQDLDLRIHIKGTMDVNGIAKIDRQLQKIFNEFASWEEAVEKIIWMVMGDNGHAPMRHKRNDAQIKLNQLLSTYRIAKINRALHLKDQLVISVNQRMAYIYVLDPKIAMHAIAEKLKLNHRIDVIAWKEDDWIRVESSTIEGSLHFRKADEVTDKFGQQWKVRGNLAILDVKIESDKVVFGKFPDVFARIFGAMHAQAGRFLVVNAQPGYEFKAPLTPSHPSAAHGSLHLQESLVPLIIAGTSEKPKHLRIVDLKEFIIRHVL